MISNGHFLNDYVHTTVMTTKRKLFRPGFAHLVDVYSSLADAANSLANIEITQLSRCTHQNSSQLVLLCVKYILCHFIICCCTVTYSTG